MGLLYVAPLVAMILGVARKRPALALPGLIAYGVMSAAYAPTVRLYRLPLWRALTLPLAGLFYTAMTADSGLRHARGSGGTWKVAISLSSPIHEIERAPIGVQRVRCAAGELCAAKCVAYAYAGS